MSDEAFKALGSNAALLLAMVFLYDVALRPPKRSNSLPRNLILGLGLSTISVAVMHQPWIFGQGIIFDTRSVLISLCGLFFGTVPVAVVMAVSAGARVLQGGGPAILTGILVITASGVTGLVWRHRLQRPLADLGFGDLLKLGLVVHVAMLLLMLTLPWPTSLTVIRTIATPVMTIYPLATAAIGLLMVNRLRREKAAEALLVSEDQYRTLFEAMVQGVLCHDPDGRVQSANPAAATILGQPVDRIVGRNLFTEGWFAQREDGSPLPDLESPPGQAASSGRAVEDVVLGLRGPGGQVRLLRTTSVPRFQPDQDRPYQVYTVFEDITERRQAAAEKAAIQTRLTQSQRMESLGLMAGGVAHDFNNLLMGILGNAELLRDALPPASPLQDNVNLVELAAQRAARLTQDLLTFSRGSVVRPVVLDPNQAVAEAADLLRRTIPATVEIVRDFQDGIWRILVDPTQLTQVLLNLAVNARDAMQNKGTLTLITRNRVVDPADTRPHDGARNGEFVVISVQDTGPGIPDEIVPRLFEPFQTTKPVGQGTGLGLSIVYGALKQAGGWIVVHSTPESGARFDLFLPRCLESAARIPESHPPRLQEGRGTILVVEDEPVVQRVVTSILLRSGYEVLVARDGAEALEILKARIDAVDLVLTDMTMPGMTAQEVVDGLRLLKPDVPILLNSGNAAGSNVKQMLDDGLIQGFLAKPYDVRQLREAVARLLARPGGQAGRGAPPP